MGNRGFGSGGRGVIQTSICPIDDCMWIRTAACSVPKALALDLEAVQGKDGGGTQRRNKRNKDMYDKTAITERLYADVDVKLD